MAAFDEEDPTQVRAAQILVSLRCRKVRRRPEWVPMQPGQASTSARDHVAAAEVMRSGEASSARTVAAGVPLRQRPERVPMQPSQVSTSARDRVAAELMRSAEASPARTVAAGAPPLRKRPERVSMHSGETSFSLAGTLAAAVPERWPKGKRSGARAETSRELEQGHPAAPKGSGARSSEQKRCAEMPAASAQQRPVVPALCFVAVAAAGSGPSTSAKPAEEPMKSPSPNSTLDGAGGSGTLSSADDAAPAPAKRKGTDDRGSVGGDDEGCCSPAKRGPVAQEEKPTPISVESSVQSETRASSGKGAPRPFDLNLCPLDEDDDVCPDTN